MKSSIPYVIDAGVLLQEEAYLYDPGAERAFLACVMHRPELVVEAERLVRPDWLFIGMHQYVYRVMLFVAQQAAKNGWALSFDDVTVMSVAKLAGQEFVDNFLRKTEGMAKWQEIADFARYVSLDQFPRHAATIKDRAARVALFRKARQLQMAAMDMEANPDAGALACEYEGHLSGVAFGSSNDDDAKLRRLGEYSRPLLHKARLNVTFPDRHLFHIRHNRFAFWMDLMGGGFRRNSLTIVAARPKVGKTTLLLNLAIDLALMNVPVLFLDTEMSGEEMISRELSNLSMVDEHSIIAGKFLNDGASLRSVYDAVARLDDAPLFYTSMAGKPIEFALSMMRQFRNQHVGTDTVEFEGQRLTVTRPCAVFYDWLKLPSVSALSDGAKEYQLLGEIATTLKDAAKVLNLPVIAGAQNNRNAVGKDEQEHVENAEAHVANSDRLIQFCNTLCILRNPTQKMQEAIEANWPNHRPGEEHSNAWKFNQILQIVVQRQGRECRTGIPMHLHRGRAHYEEVADEESMKFLRDFIRDSRARRRTTKGGDGPAPPPIAPPRQQQPPPAPASAAPASTAAASAATGNCF